MSHLTSECSELTAEQQMCQCWSTHSEVFSCALVNILYKKTQQTSLTKIPKTLFIFYYYFYVCVIPFKNISTIQSTEETEKHPFKIYMPFWQQVLHLKVNLQGMFTWVWFKKSKTTNLPRFKHPVTFPIIIYIIPPS